MAGGVKRSAVLQDMGAYAGRVDVERVWIDQLYFHPEGHPLHHPRVDKPADEELVADIMVNGIKKAALVRIEFDDKGNKVLAVCYGSRRYNAGIEAEKRLRKAKNTTILKQDEDGEWRLPIKVEFLPQDTTDADFLIARQAEDKDPLKKDHDVEVLAKSVIALDKAEVPAATILSLMPKGWTKKHIEAVVSLWGSMKKSQKIIERFNSGELAIGMLPAVLNTSPDKREALVEELLAAGVTSTGSVTRHLNATAAAAAQAAEDGVAPVGGPEGNPDLGVPDVEDDGLDATKSDPPPASAPRNVTKPPQTAKPANSRPVQAMNLKTVRKLITYVREEKSSTTIAENAFVLGVQAACFNRDDAKEIAKLAADLPEAAKNLLAGVLLRAGIFPACIEALVSARVLENLAHVTSKSTKADKPAKEPKPKAEKKPREPKQGRKGKKSKK